jgi:hypothetical protein
MQSILTFVAWKAWGYHRGIIIAVIIDHSISITVIIDHLISITVIIDHSVSITVIIDSKYYFIIVRTGTTEGELKFIVRRKTAWNRSHS